MPMRTPFTPALPTAILLCALAITVSGNSTSTRFGDFNALNFGVTGWEELISICTLSAPVTTFTFCSWLCCAGFAAASGLEDGIAAGFTAGAGAPGAGLAFAGAAGLGALDCFCCSDFAVLRALSMASGFCAATAAQEPPVIIASARMPVVSFIAIPTSPPAFLA